MISMDSLRSVFGEVEAALGELRWRGRLVAHKLAAAAKGGRPAHSNQRDGLRHGAEEQKHRHVRQQRIDARAHNETVHGHWADRAVHGIWSRQRES
jgi:hypothetical protein